MSYWDSDILETLSPQARKRVLALKNLQRQHDQLKAKFLEEKATLEAALEAKYVKLYEPLYTKRYEIVNGVVEVEGVDLDPVDQCDKKGPRDEKGVPGFWLNALKSNEIFTEEISERDEEALKFLKDIKWCKINDPKGFKLEFFFDANPFFKNSVLTKTYHMINDKVAENAIGTDIEWYPGKCLTKEYIYPPGHINNTRRRGRYEIPEWKPKKVLKNEMPIIRTEDCQSFFEFFKSPQAPEDDSDPDSDSVSRLHDHMEQDYEAGSEIRDKIIPQAVLWFTGEAAEDDDSEDMDDDTEEEDDEDEDEDKDEYAKDYEDQKFEKSLGPKVSNLSSLPSGSSLVQPARSTLNASAPPFIPNLAYGVKREFNVTTFDSATSFIPNIGYGVEKEFNVATFDSYSKEDDSSDDEYLERMKKKRARTQSGEGQQVGERPPECKQQ